jgi:hypothetical protein
LLSSAVQTLQLYLKTMTFAKLSLGAVCICGITGKQAKVEHRVELKSYFDNLRAANLRVCVTLYIFAVTYSRIVSSKVNTRIQETPA